MTRTVARPTQNPWRIFRWPLAVAACTVGGLLSALMGDAVYDALSWTLLGAVVLVMWMAYRV